jgi:hypothetical protein
MFKRLSFSGSVLMILILFPLVDLHSQSFEGNIYGMFSQKDRNLFVWFDLRLPAENGAASGSYFYKNVGKEISLSGNKNGSQITLVEKDKNQNITGIFQVNYLNNTLKGCWYQPGKRDTLSVILYRTNPVFKKMAKIPKLKDLLSEDIEFYNEGLHTSDTDEEVTYYPVFSGSGMLSVELHWENYSYTAHYGTIHHTYDLSTKEIIDLKNEITDTCNSYLCKKLQEIVDNERGVYPDSEWVEGLNPLIDNFEYGDTTAEYKTAALERIEGLFTVASLPEKSELYFDKDGLNCYVEDYCEQYFSAGNRGMTFNCLVTIPFNELKQFIKPGSVVLNLFQSDTEKNTSFK